MSDVFDDLARHYTQLARTRRRWAKTPPITDIVPPDTIEILDALVRVIRDDSPEHQLSDQAVRALAYLGIDEPDALAVLLHALAPTLRSRMWRSTTTDHTADALGDLVFVIFDSVAAGEMDHITRLAHRLVNRAHNRVHKRSGRVAPLPCSPDTISTIGATKAPDVADLVAARTDIARFAQSIETAVASGRISARGWHAFRYQRLSRSITGETPRAAVNDRNMASRAARKVRTHANVHLLCHSS